MKIVALCGVWLLVLCAGESTDPISKPSHKLESASAAKMCTDLEQLLDQFKKGASDGCVPLPVRSCFQDHQNRATAKDLLRLLTPR